MYKNSNRFIQKMTAQGISGHKASSLAAKGRPVRGTKKVGLGRKLIRRGEGEAADAEWQRYVSECEAAGINPVKRNR